MDLWIAAQIDQRFDRVAGFRDRPFQSAVNGPFFFCLGRVEGLDRVGIIVRQNAERISRLRPFLFAQSFNRFAIPFHRRITRAAPFTVFDVKDMILEVFKLAIRSFRAFQEIRMVFQQKIFPISGITPFEDLQGVKCDEVVRRTTPVRNDDKLKQVHSQPPDGLCGQPALG